MGGWLCFERRKDPNYFSPCDCYVCGFLKLNREGVFKYEWLFEPWKEFGVLTDPENELQYDYHELTKEYVIYMLKLMIRHVELDGRVEGNMCFLPAVLLAHIGCDVYPH